MSNLWQKVMIKTKNAQHVFFSVFAVVLLFCVEKSGTRKKWNATTQSVIEFCRCDESYACTRFPCAPSQRQFKCYLKIQIKCEPSGSISSWKFCCTIQWANCIVCECMHEKWKPIRLLLEQYKNQIIRRVFFVLQFFFFVVAFFLHFTFVPFYIRSRDKTGHSSFCY